MKKQTKIKPIKKEKLVIKENLVIIPKSESEKGLVSIGFEDEEKPPIQNIKKIKKALPKPLVKEIQQPKPAELPKSAYFPSISADFVAEELMEIKEHKEPDIDSLEKEIMEKMKLLEQKKLEDAEKKLREEQERKIKEEEEIKIKEEQEIKRLEEERLKQEEIIRQEEILEEKKIIHEIKLNPYGDLNIRICPVCSKKLKRFKVRQDGFMLMQTIKCKNKSCSFQKEMTFML